jgi:hypothetical protein
MHRIVSQRVEKRHSLGRNTHIGQKFHGWTGSNGWTVSSASQAT